MHRKEYAQKMDVYVTKIIMGVDVLRSVIVIYLVQDLENVLIKVYVIIIVIILPIAIIEQVRVLMLLVRVKKIFGILIVILEKDVMLQQ